MREILAVYPFCEEVLSLVRHKEKMVDYELKYGIIPKGWDDLSEIEPQCKEIICSEEKFYTEKAIETTDVILLCKTKFSTDTAMYQQMIHLAEEHGKKIMYMPDLQKELNIENKEAWICLENDLNLPLSNVVEKIGVPVAMVLGLGENCEKLEIQIQLNEFFKKKGYRTSLISSNPCALLLGVHILPSFLFKNDLNFTEKIENFNSFIRDIERREKPDIIIIGVPGAPYKFSRTIPNGYGYIPFIISNAVMPDISILSLHCGEYSDDKIQDIKSTFLYRFDIRLNYFHMSKKVLHYSFENSRIEYYFVDDAYVVNEYIRAKHDYPLFYVLDPESRESLFEKMLLELQNNIAVM